MANIGKIRLRKKSRLNPIDPNLNPKRIQKSNNKANKKQDNKIYMIWNKNVIYRFGYSFSYV